MYYASVFAIARNFLFTLTNTLAFSVTELITAVKCFVIQALVLLCTSRNQPNLAYFDIMTRAMQGKQGKKFI